MGASRSHSMRLLVTGVAVLTLLVSGYRAIDRVRAEQAGGSPQSGADSRLTQLSSSLESLNYGSEEGGSWGDWGIHWNRIRSAAETPFNDALVNGLPDGSGGTNIPGCETPGEPECYPQDLGGVDDFNNNGIYPADSYMGSWTTCSAGNNYCGLGNSGGNIAEKLDRNTGLIWSNRVATTINWFTANNCAQPGSAENPSSCATHGDAGCVCIKLDGENKTGCEAQTANGGGWRLPSYKEILQAHIDGARGQLSEIDERFHISGTTFSSNTTQAYSTTLTRASNVPINKTSAQGNRTYRCVRRP